MQFLITNDVRCFGYLIDTSLFLINKLKINAFDFSNEQNWSYYTDQSAFNPEIIRK